MFQSMGLACTEERKCPSQRDQYALRKGKITVWGFLPHGKYLFMHWETWWTKSMYSKKRITTYFTLAPRALEKVLKIASGMYSHEETVLFSYRWAIVQSSWELEYWAAQIVASGVVLAIVPCNDVSPVCSLTPQQCLVQDSPPAGNRKRRIARGITCPSVICLRGGGQYCILICILTWI